MTGGVSAVGCMPLFGGASIANKYAAPQERPNDGLP
jgi:hypothetical protein